MFPSCCLQIANHPLLVRRIYKDADIVRFAKKLYPMGVFGHECTLDRVIDEMKGYSDFSIHRVILISICLLAILDSWNSIWCSHYIASIYYYLNSTMFYNLLDALCFRF